MGEEAAEKIYEIAGQYSLAYLHVTFRSAQLDN